jgi:hypothetical protein
MSARSDLMELVNKGYLLNRSVDKKKKGYVKGDKIDLLLKWARHLKKRKRKNQRRGAKKPNSSHD